MVECCIKEDLVQGLVSVIIPVYKVEKYVQGCLTSIVRQSYNNIEIILVDDAGEDDSMKLAEAVLQGSDVPWRVHKHACNKGVSEARNNGADCAKGEFLFFVDSDDYISDTCIEKLVQSAYDNQSDIVFGSFVYDYEGKIEPSHWMYSEDRCSDAPLHEHIAQNAFVMPWNKLIKHSFYLKAAVKFKEGIRYEDEPWSFSLIIRAHKISFLKEVTYFYRIWSGSFMNVARYNRFRIDSLYCHLENCSAESYHFNLWENHEFKTWYARIIFAFFDKVFDSDLPSKDKVGFLNKVYSEIRIPEAEMNQIALYSFAKKMALVLPNYQWLKLLVKVKRLKNVISLKLRNLFD